MSSTPGPMRIPHIMRSPWTGGGAPRAAFAIAAQSVVAGANAAPRAGGTHGARQASSARAMASAMRFQLAFSSSSCRRPAFVSV